MRDYGWLLSPLLLLIPLVALAQPMTIGCGGYVAPVFPEAAGKEYENTCWVARVEKDEFTDVTSCRIYPAGTKHEAYPFAFFTQDGESVAVAGGRIFPGSTTMIRVDDNEAVSGGERFSSSTSELLLRQMSAGAVIRARFSEWPSNLYKSGQLDAAGFSEALEFCRGSVR